MPERFVKVRTNPPLTLHGVRDREKEKTAWFVRKRDRDVLLDFIRSREDHPDRLEYALGLCVWRTCEGVSNADE